MRKKTVSIAITALVVASLLAAAQPASAVAVSVDGPDEVRQTEEFTFTSTVEIRDGEQVPIESYTLHLTPEDGSGEAATVTFAPNGTVLGTTPAEGVVGDGRIRMDLLRETIAVTPVTQDAEYGYGYGYAVDERTGEEVEFGYGYGYGYGGDGGTFAFDIALDAQALKHGDYTARLSVNTAKGDDTFASNEQAFSVVVPAANPGRPSEPKFDWRSFMPPTVHVSVGDGGTAIDIWNDGRNISIDVGDESGVSIDIGGGGPSVDVGDGPSVDAGTGPPADVGDDEADRGNRGKGRDR